MTTEENAPQLGEPIAPKSHRSAWPLPITDESTEIPQIHRAMLAIKTDMPDIAKNGKMQLGGKEIPFTKIDDIKSSLYPILERHGVMTYLVFIDQESSVTAAHEPWSGAQPYPAGHELAGTIIPTGRPLHDGRIPTRSIRVQVIYDVRFVFVGDNSEVSVRVIGEAMDTSSDKATGKATTAAIKRAFVETFAIVDHTELDIEADNPDDRNRKATTDRTEGAGDRGAQNRNAAKGAGSGVSGTRRSGPSRSAPAKAEAPEAEVEVQADTETGEVAQEAAPAPAAPPAETELDKQKSRVRSLVGPLGYDTPTINAIASEVTGKELRTEWIVLPTAVKKLADELQKRFDEKMAAE